MCAEMLTGIGEQVERVEMRIAYSDGDSDLLINSFAKPGTTMSDFVAAQVPSNYELVAKLPNAAGGSLFMAGTFRAGKASEVLSAFAAQYLAVNFNFEDDAQARRDMYAAMDGDFALQTDIEYLQGSEPSIQMSYLIGANDASGLRSVFRMMMRQLLDVQDKNDGAADLMGEK